MSSFDSAPPLGDLPEGGGLLQVRIAAVAIYDQSLLDGIAVWVEDDPGFEELPGDPDTEGRTSDWNRRATVRGYRLWELRRLITQDYSEDATSGTNEDSGDPYIWANKAGAKQSVLSRVANLAFWSPSRRTFRQSEDLEPSLETRAHDVWTREKLGEFWELLRRRALDMSEGECTVDDISMALRVHQHTVEEWLAATDEGES